MHPDSTFLAWLAGFIDGEGYLWVRRFSQPPKPPFYSPHLSVSSTDRAAIDEIIERLGVGWLLVRPRPGQRTEYRWTVTGSAVRAVATAVRPYLRVKAAQADLLLGFRLLGDGGTKDEQQRIHSRMRALNGWRNAADRSVSAASSGDG